MGRPASRKGMVAFEVSGGSHRLGVRGSLPIASAGACPNRRLRWNTLLTLGDHLNQHTLSSPPHESRNIPQHLRLHVQPTPGRRQRRQKSAARHDPSLVHEESQEKAIGKGAFLLAFFLSLLLLSSRFPQACDPCHKSKRRCDGTGAPGFPSMHKCLH